MVLPVSSDTAAEAYALLRQHGRASHAMALELNGMLGAPVGGVRSGAVPATFLLDVATTAAFIADNITAIRNTPGLADYTRAQLGLPPEADVGTMLTTSVIALARLAGAIRVEYPQNEDGFFLDRKFQADGQVAPVTIPAAQLPNTSAALADFLATIA